MQCQNICSGVDKKIQIVLLFWRIQIQVLTDGVLKRYRYKISLNTEHYSVGGTSAFSFVTSDFWSDPKKGERRAWCNSNPVIFYV